MKIEQPYEFREFLNQIHLPDRRNNDVAPVEADEIKIDGSWFIRIPADASAGLRRAASDLQDYFFVSMKESLKLVISDEKQEKEIVLTEKWKKGDAPSDICGDSRAYDYTCEKNAIRVDGDTWVGAAQGGYYLEDLMNLRQIPVLRLSEKIRRTPFFSPRMTHSGYGLDQFPDNHLAGIAHSGFDSIIVMLTGPDKTRQGPLDVNTLIRRAAKFGLGVYIYSYLSGYKHPEDSDAEGFFDSSYGSLFRHSPDARGLILVSESCEFPTKDPRASSHLTTPGGANPYTQGICGDKPGSGWFPCSDYPLWVDAVKNACRKYNPTADVIFWTYGFGRAPEEPQQNMIRKLSKDVSLLVTFEMYQQRKFPHHMVMQSDYSITFPGPSSMFTCEAEAAKEIGLTLYAMTNTGGRTWDAGIVPYIPVPQQWMRRYEKMHEARRQYGLSGLMDSHHFGWYPSVISECAKWSFWSPETNMKEVLDRIACRDFGSEGGPLAVQAWDLWSESMNHYAPSFGDQCATMRVGAAYPFVFLPYLYPFVEQDMQYPATPQSVCGSSLMHPAYFPEMVFGASACGRMMHEDIKALENVVIPAWNRGVELMKKAVELTPVCRKATAEKSLGVGMFFRAMLRSTLHNKKWFILNRRLEIENDFVIANQIMDDMLTIVDLEMKNVKEVIPIAENDSILGWEPRMDYQGGVWHLNWKIRQLENLRDNTLQVYRKTLSENVPFSRERTH
ncbi:MAG: hypothetical protein ACI4UV_09000 [Victivallales bacterium]